MESKINAVNGIIFFFIIFGPALKDWPKLVPGQFRYFEKQFKTGIQGPRIQFL